jgi:hypothetical protein
MKLRKILLLRIKTKKRGNERDDDRLTCLEEEEEGLNPKTQTLVTITKAVVFKLKDDTDKCFLLTITIGPSRGAGDYFFFGNK